MKPAKSCAVCRAQSISVVWPGNLSTFATKAERKRSFLRAVLFAAFLLLGAAQFIAGPARADIIETGDAVITGFSGVKAADPAASGDPFDETFIDLDGASMQIHKLEPKGPPDGQLIDAPVSFKAKASDIGQVFAIGLDAGDIASSKIAPNIYLGATLAFGLQIVLPDSDGDGRPERVKNGHPNAEWMPGQFGPDGGPGSIWKVDGTTGEVSLFATISGNTGPGIGDIVYDLATRQFFVSDLDTGLIHRLSGDGTLIDVFDHGESGRPAAELPAVVDDGKVADIKSASFDALNPDTWGLAPPERLVWGLGVHSGRLYYAVASGPEIWSVGINLDGTFADDPRREIEVVGTPSDFPISDITFDNQGIMYVAQRGGIRGSWDYAAFTEPKKSVVWRYKRELPDDPETPGTWVPIPDEYAVGFPPDYRNTSGGLALGYGYDEAGQVFKGTCGQMLWSTGNDLRNNPELASELAAGGPASVHGLQGNDRRLIRPDNEPPAVAYFVDYDGASEDPEKSGHVGDVEIWQPCATDEATGEFIYELPQWTGDTPPSSPPSESFNLQVTKTAEPGQCWTGGIGWQCGFTVRATNTGPGFFFGDITVTDWLPDPPPGTVMTFGPQPPWNCTMLSRSEYQCTHPSVGLYPGESVDLFVVVESPADDPRCFVDNAVRIDWPAGYGDSDPADDIAFASAEIPSSPCADRPPEGEKSNLQIRKSPVGETCSIVGSDYRCAFLIEVTNTGPGWHGNQIEIDERLSFAATSAIFTGPWSCTGSGVDYHCTAPSVGLNPGQSVFLAATFVVPQTIGQCQFGNQAKIAFSPGGSDANTDPGDDIAPSAITIPSAACIGTQTNLQLEKSPNPGICTPGTDSWRCGYTVIITNGGPGLFDGHIKFDDSWVNAPAGATLTPPSGWLCIDFGALPNFSCTTQNPVALAPTDAVAATFWLEIPATSGGVCSQANTALLVEPAAGSAQNTDGSDDKDQATATFPPLNVGDQRLCPPRAADLEERVGPLPPSHKKDDAKEDEEEGEKEPVCPTGWTKTPIPGKCCPHGTSWDGESCKRGGAPTEEPSTPEPPQCEKGWKQVTGRDIMTYRNKGYRMKSTGSGSDTIWCAQEGKPECWSGWTEIAAKKTKSAIRQGYKVRPRREGNQTIWCALKESAPPSEPPPPTTPTPPPSDDLSCWRGWFKIGAGERKAYRNKGYKVSRRRKGKRRVWCAKPGDVSPPSQSPGQSAPTTPTPTPTLPDCPPPAVGKFPFCKCGPGYKGKWPKCREIEPDKPWDECRKKGWRWTRGRGCIPPRNSDNGGNNSGNSNQSCPFGYIGKPPDCKKVKIKLKEKDKKNLKKLFDALQGLKKN